MTNITTHSSATRIQFSNAIVSAVGSGGFLKIYTSGLASLLLQYTFPSTFGTVDGGTGLLTANGMPLAATAIATGVAAEFTVTTSGGTVVYGGNVGLPPLDFTADYTTDTLTVTGHNHANGDIVTVFGPSLPSPLTVLTNYEVGNVSGGTLKLYKDRSVVNLTNNGSGILKISSNPALTLNAGTSLSPSLSVTTGQILSISSLTYTPSV